MSDLIENRDYIICPLCQREGKPAKRRKIGGHIRIHGISFEEFKKQFPNHPTECTDVYEKRKQTNQEKYGVDNSFQTEEVKAETRERFEDPNFIRKRNEKTKKTSQERYGVDNPSKNLEIIEKIKQSHKKVDKEASLKKRKDTCLERYGVESPMQLEETKEKMKENWLKSLGVDNPRKSEGVLLKQRETMLEHFDGKWNSQTEEWKEKMSAAWANKTDEEKQRIVGERKKTSLEKYGVDNPSKSLEVKKKIKQTTFERFGVEHILMLPEHQGGFLKKWKDEQLFDDLTPSNIVYVGDGKFWIKIPGTINSICPDFIVRPVTESKKVIEIFGDYFHSERNAIPKEKAEQERTALLKQANYECLIVWESNLNNNPQEVVRRTKEFCGKFWQEN